MSFTLQEMQAVMNAVIEAIPGAEASRHPCMAIDTDILHSSQFIVKFPNGRYASVANSSTVIDGKDIYPDESATFECASMDEEKNIDQRKVFKYLTLEQLIVLCQGLAEDKGDTFDSVSQDLLDVAHDYEDKWLDKDTRKERLLDIESRLYGLLGAHGLAW